MRKSLLPSLKNEKVAANGSVAVPKATEIMPEVLPGAVRELRRQGYGDQVPKSVTPISKGVYMPTGIRTMSEPMNMTFAAIRWVIIGFLPEGLAILSGPPKIGKSWLVMNLCIAAVTGGLALGKFLVDPGEVLLLSLEDNDRRLQERLKKCLDGALSDLSTFYAKTTWQRLDNGGLNDLAIWLENHPACRLVCN